MATYYMYLY